MLVSKQKPRFPLACASIDIGSNAIRLLIAELTEADSPTKKILNLELQERWRAYLRLGAEVFSQGFISQTAQTQLIEVIQGFLSKLCPSTPSCIRMTATSAMRDASNQAEVRAAIFDATGVSIELLQGKEEAQCLLNAFAHFPLDQEILALADLGGGSLEISFLEQSVANPSSLLLQQSLNYGALRLKTLAVSSSYEVLILPLRNALHAMKAQLKEKGDLNAIHLFLAGGAAKILADLLPKLGIVSKSKSQWFLPLTSKEFLEIHFMLREQTTEQLIHKWDISPQQADLIPAALEVFRVLKEVLAPSMISLSLMGLKEASMLEVTQTHFPEHSIHLGTPLSTSPHILQLPYALAEEQ